MSSLEVSLDHPKIEDSMNTKHPAFSCFGGDNYHALDVFYSMVVVSMDLLDTNLDYLALGNTSLDYALRVILLLLSGL